MEKKYVVKDFATGKYWCGEFYKFDVEPYMVERFNSIGEAERFIERQNGTFIIETIYVV